MHSNIIDCPKIADMHLEPESGKEKKKKKKKKKKEKKRVKNVDLRTAENIKEKTQLFFSFLDEFL